MISPPRATLGTVVVRAWVEAGADAEDVRARVLLIRESDAVAVELGAAAGLGQVLELVREALLEVGPEG